MKRAALFILSLISVVMLAGCILGDLRPVPVDVVPADNDIYFVLEEPKEIEGIYVTLHLPPDKLVERAKEAEEKKAKITMWAVEHVNRTEIKERIYPELKQIRYGGQIAGLATMEGPFKLEKNVKYKVKVEIVGREFSSEIFMITNDNKVIMPDPTFSRQRNRSYSVSVDTEGNKILIPVSGNTK